MMSILFTLLCATGVAAMMNASSIAGSVSVQSEMAEDDDFPFSGSPMIIQVEERVISTATIPWGFYNLTVSYSDFLEDSKYVTYLVQLDNKVSVTGQSSTKGEYVVLKGTVDSLPVDGETSGLSLHSTLKVRVIDPTEAISE